MEYFRENKSLTMEVIMAEKKETKETKKKTGWSWKKVTAIAGGIATFALGVVLLIKR